MCRLRNIAMCDYQESMTTGQTHGQTDTQTDRQTPDKVIPMCLYASQTTQYISVGGSARDSGDFLFTDLSKGTKMTMSVKRRQVKSVISKLF